jgi:hypothetical protein
MSTIQIKALLDALRRCTGDSAKDKALRATLRRRLAEAEAAATTAHHRAQATKRPA